MNKRAENSTPSQTNWDSIGLPETSTDTDRMVLGGKLMPRLWEGAVQPGSNEYMLREILEHLPQAVAAFDANNCLFAWNSRHQEIFDLPDNLMKVGTSWQTLVTFLAERGDYGAINPSELIAERSGLTTERQTSHREIQLRGDRIFAVTRSPLLSYMWLLTFHDITEQKQAEAEMKAQHDELVRSNMLKDKLFSIVAHDLRSPFNTVLGFAQLIADHAEQATRQELGDYAQEINRSGSRLLQLVDNLLRWSRSQMGDTTFKATAQPLAPLIERAVALQTKTAAEKGITLEYTPQYDRVSVDSDMIESILRNLVSNAIKFTEKGGTIVIATAAIDSQRIEISVTDTGIGMDDDHLSDLFDFMASQSRNGTQGEPRTGLGLQICSEFAAAHGSEIDVESALGTGSTFRFSVPMTHAD
jgi:signal transduction histidine kinase